MRFLTRFAILVLVVSLGLTAAELQVPFWAPQGTTVLPEEIQAAINDAPAPVVSVRQPTDDLVLLVVLDLTNDLAAVTQARNALTARIAEFPSESLRRRAACAKRAERDVGPERGPRSHVRGDQFPSGGWTGRSAEYD